MSYINKKKLFKKYYFLQVVIWTFWRVILFGRLVLDIVMAPVTGLVPSSVSTKVCFIFFKYFAGVYLIKIFVKILDFLLTSKVFWPPVAFVYFADQSKNELK